jgi:4,5-DOPA dioxygenase extradiol
MKNNPMPVIFFGHGSPMNAIEENSFSKTWELMSEILPRPKVILCISAHWETHGAAKVTAMIKPETIHDFGGFPRVLNEKQYPAPGSPELAQQIAEMVKITTVLPDQTWGLDHGTWSVLCRLYPQADIPVVQLSLDRSHDPAFHYALGKELQSLREEGILVIGSGNLVHNLRMLSWNEEIFDWASEYDEKVKQWILAGDHESIIHYEKNGRAAQLSVNSGEHYLPLLYILGLQRTGEPVHFFNEGISYGSLSMRGVQIG